jgi:N-acyl-D-aspartate/D-glutamate deacylase
MARFDLIFRNALLYDGSGAPPRRGDLAVTGEHITALGDLGGMSADHEIEAGHLALKEKKVKKCKTTEIKRRKTAKK